MNGVSHLWAQILELGTSCAVNPPAGHGKWLTLAVPQFAHMQREDKNIPPHWGHSED